MVCICDGVAHRNRLTYRHEENVLQSAFSTMDGKTDLCFFVLCSYLYLSKRYKPLLSSNLTHLTRTMKASSYTETSQYLFRITASKTASCEIF